MNQAEPQNCSSVQGAGAENGSPGQVASVDQYAFAIELPSLKTFVELLNALSAVGDEIVFTVDYERLRVEQMDPSHVSMVILRMPREACYSWDVNEPLSFSVDVKELLKLLKGIDEKCRVALKYFRAKEKLEITVKDYVATYSNTITVYSPVGDDYHVLVPSLEFKASVVIRTDQFYKLIRQYELISDYVEIILDPEKLQMIAKGDSRSMENTFTQNSSLVVDISCSSGIRVLFSLTYLERMLKQAKRLGKTAVIYLNTNKPLKIDASTPNFDLLYLLAPRMPD
jgi:proliferating cell nuclear antigen